MLLVMVLSFFACSPERDWEIEGHDEKYHTSEAD